MKIYVRDSVKDKAPDGSWFVISSESELRFTMNTLHRLPNRKEKIHTIMLPRSVYGHHCYCSVLSMFGIDKTIFEDDFAVELYMSHGVI